MDVPSLPAQPARYDCPQCGQRMSLGQALDNEAPGPGPMIDDTASTPKPMPHLVDCLKCHGCGHSETLPDDWQYPCPKCKEPMTMGMALYSDENPSEVTTDQNADPRLLPCLKCVGCGHSETLPPDWGLPWEITREGLPMEQLVEAYRQGTA